MAKLIYVQLETCHANNDAVAWYAYYEGEPTVDELNLCFEDDTRVASSGLGWLGEEGAEEVPTPLSKAAGLRRYCVDGAG